MTRKAHRRPIVGIPCDVKMLGPHPFHAVGEKYLAAVDGGADCQPILLPVPREPFKEAADQLDEIFALCDGIFLTGSHSNVHPENYGGTPPREGVLLDRQRDALTLTLIRHCVERSVPLFAVCRGFQELNVAFGGTLHQHIHEVPSEPGFAPRFDHRENKDDPLDIQYGPAHDVMLEAGGAFENLLGTRTIEVNSLHGQGVARIADALVAEGRAADGTVEAMRVRGAAAFALGVQWHPEWKYWENPVSQKLFRAFGDAVREAAAANAETERVVSHGDGQRTGREGREGRQRGRPDQVA
ncbi:gamma-glutamyl-gamma-aminobutyrate hydrolase family protein [Parvibaculum sp.]|uniref:gamma-glutamyl-gamma-aminobutyrate hydrolase family protein n=1 Tax=Parvibaculum sp. TaxID=2024848 RepID=UPI00272FDA90|nr:gamma-glutamyl-gamma-aminobutyrate hydrolase family protein [Parvibaculum sp.]MDP1625930.1 gamma-glutamyl-gamma-aminobutyrate hydrolase family protein [Parvibaculum sp.]MDP2149634.1 gamma-glutamyl-gamma-aminobutyrate hydrolase family protein [Parvibaculum sp.]MDP3329623.1 gamma-glutamyl-gamma-aminobutyrate hydrolase family protein [Parvibaculum sp.]